MRRFFVCTLLVSSIALAFAMALGACGDSCIDTGCIAPEAGSDVKDASKKDAAKDASDAATPGDAGDAASDAPNDATGDATTDATTD